MPITEQIESFARFARERVNERGENVEIEELFDEWRVLNPPSEDWLAIKASLDDMARGETGRPIEEFLAEFRQAHVGQVLE